MAAKPLTKEFGVATPPVSEVAQVCVPLDCVLLDEFDERTAEIKNLQQTIDEETDNLNSEVYELYEVSGYPDDIEEYLESFLKVIT